MRVVHLVTGVVLSSVLGCGAPDRQPLEVLDFAGVGGPGGNVDFMGVDLPGLTDDLAMTLTGPAVVILTPQPNCFVVGQTLIVNARVTPKQDQTIDTVQLKISKAVPMGNEPTAPMSKTKGPDEYEGSIDVSSHPSGKIEIQVTATDLMKGQGAAKIACQRDAGPVITPISPKNQTYRGSAPMEFDVADFYGVDPKSVTAAVQDIVPENFAQKLGANKWTGVIDFHSPKFKMSLNLIQVLHVTASNINKTTTELDMPFVVDEEGPAIMIDTPKPGSFVGGFITIKARISDPSGVAVKSVVAVIQDFDQLLMKNSEHVVPLAQENPMSDVFTGMFDTRTLNPFFVFSHISIRAKDSIGNDSDVSEQVVVDNVAPAIDMDPPLTRVRKFDPMKGAICTHIFDPVGDESTDDGDIQNQLVWLRVRVEDSGNVALGQAAPLTSNIDPASLEMYVIPAGDGPIVVDTNGDGVCDDFNPELKPTTQVLQQGLKQALAIGLIPLAPGGNPNFVSDMTNIFTKGCDEIGEDMALWPENLAKGCPTTMTYSIGHSADLKEPSVWVVPPINGKFCTGYQLDLLNKMPDGPSCVAVRARDRAGNRNVSRPIRVCIDRFGKGTCDGKGYRKHKSGVSIDFNKFPHCTGTLDGNKKVNNTECRSKVKLNTGIERSPYPNPDEPYFLP
ncbi:MAG: hypothetical protein EXR72_09855 [Myxococcales bacterium]|nr:hypothetical protein [Myxococcales bacterium]